MEKFSKEWEESLIKDYLNKISLKDLKLKYQTSSDTIYKIIDKNNIKRHNSKDLSKFKQLNNKQVQYWLGYICADGNIEYIPEKRIYKISLFSIDEEVMVNFKEFFGDIVKRYSRKNSNVMECAIHSKELCEYFINELNIVPNKGLVLNPNIDFNPNFLLGYFDGDGSIANSSEERTRYEAKFTSGSKVFINKIKEILDDQGIYSIIREKGNAFDLCIERKSDSEKLYKYLYQYKPTCLSRKFNNFVALFGNLEENNWVNCEELNGQFAAKLDRDI